MKRKGFTPTTAILIAVLLVPVYLIAQKVTPPPPGPPEPPKAVTPASAAGGDQVKEGAEPKMDPMEQRKAMERKYRQMATQKRAAAKSQPKFNPNSIDVTADYWKDHTDGAAGIEQTQKQVDEAKAEQAKIEATGKAEAPKNTAASGKMEAVK